LIELAPSHPFYKLDYDEQVECQLDHRYQPLRQFLPPHLTPSAIVLEYPFATISEQGSLRHLVSQVHSTNSIVHPACAQHSAKGAEVSCHRAIHPYTHAYPNHTFSHRAKCSKDDHMACACLVLQICRNH